MYSWYYCRVVYKVIAFKVGGTCGERIIELNKPVLQAQQHSVACMPAIESIYLRLWADLH